MDLAKLKAEHPDLVEAIVKEATADQETKLAQAKKEGAEAERLRIQEVRNQLIPGHEALIESLAFDGQTSGPEAAIKVIAAEKLSRGKALENFRQSAPQVLVQSSTDNGASADPVKARWEKMSDAEKGEFMDFENFKAYVSDDGATRIKGGKR